MAEIFYFYERENKQDSTHTSIVKLKLENDYKISFNHYYVSVSYTRENKLTNWLTET